MPHAISEWPSVSQSPVGREVRRFLQDSLRRLYRGSYPRTLDFVRDFVTGRSVLDIGFVDHAASRFDRPEWRHKHVVEWSREVLGVDILADEVEALKRRGFNAVAADATSDVFLGRTFERVFIGDVVEHVDNAVALLRFASRHLSPGGAAAVTTPNPFWWRHILAAVRNKAILCNAEHVSWVTPTMALELGRRAGLPLSSYWHMDGGGVTLKGKALRLALKGSDLTAESFIYIYGGDSE